MNRRFLVLLALLPVIGCASADPARHDSTAYPALQKAATEAQTNAAAGLTAAPAGDALKCTYETVSGAVVATVDADAKCPKKPPASATP